LNPGTPGFLQHVEKPFPIPGPQASEKNVIRYAVATAIPAFIRAHGTL
jgi:hypothetical protein